MPYIKKKTISQTKKLIKGTFYLSDKSKTNFEIDKTTHEWNQWGNVTDNLWVSVPEIEKIIKEYLPY